MPIICSIWYVQQLKLVSVYGIKMPALCGCCWRVESRERRGCSVACNVCGMSCTLYVCTYACMWHGTTTSLRCNMHACKYQWYVYVWSPHTYMLVQTSCAVFVVRSELGFSFWERLVVKRPANNQRQLASPVSQHFRNSHLLEYPSTVGNP